MGRELINVRYMHFITTNKSFVVVDLKRIAESFLFNYERLYYQECISYSNDPVTKVIEMKKLRKCFVETVNKTFAFNSTFIAYIDSDNNIYTRIIHE